MEDKRLKTGIYAVKKAGDFLKEQFHKRHEVSKKEDNSVLLGEDLKSEKIIIDYISTIFPQDSFFTEETETKISSDNVWVIDPLCGSFSYLRGVETWSISLAFISGKDYLIGVVYLPLLSYIFHGQLHKGAFLNNQQIYPSKISSVLDAFISIEHKALMSDKLNSRLLIESMKRLRVGQGSGGELSYVAAGYIDAVIKTNQAITHFAGGRAILEAAGGAFIDFAGQKAPTHFDKNKAIDYIATNEQLVNNLLSYVEK